MWASVKFWSGTMAPKRIASALLLVVLATATPAHADAKTQDAIINKERRTLFVTVGEDRLRFEAPKGMCFADKTMRTEGALLRAAELALRHKGDEDLLGLFMPCDSLVNPAMAIAREGRVPSFGMITFPHGVETTAPRGDLGAYLAYRDASFHEYAAVNLGPWLGIMGLLRQPEDTAKDPALDDGVAYSTHGIVTTYSQYLSADARPFPTVGAVATTLAHGHPVEVVMRLNAASGVTTAQQAHDFMANFIDLQAALNP